jgi:hypothetical protein
MKILITNLSLSNPGGSELWIKTVYDELRKRKCNIDVVSLKYGSFGVYFDENIGLNHKEYDLILGNHLKEFVQLHQLIATTPTIYTKHSFFLDVEKFADIADKYVCVSQEVADTEESYKPTVILNPINIEEYKPIKNKNNKPVVLYLSHDGGLASQTIVQACHSVNYEYKEISKDLPIVEQIQNADICIGIGRLLIEAMCCGKFCISGDYRHWMDSFRGAGILTNKNYLLHQYDNYSGRLTGFSIDKEKLELMLKAYDKNTGIELSEPIRREHNVKKIVDQYFALWTSIKSGI